MSDFIPASMPMTREAFDRLLGELRPKLHRYCARMTGSVIDGEDVVQEAIVKAIEAFADAGSISNAEGWLIRIAHNAAVDFLRHRARQDAIRSDEDADMIIDPVVAVNDRQIVAASLRTFMRLPVAQRSSVILMDVLGYSLDEISGITKSSIPAIKAALHRGRARLREFAEEPDELPLPVLADSERSLLTAYVDHFNARDFDAVRTMLAEEVRLELVNKSFLRRGRGEVGGYFDNYARLTDWQLVPALVDRRPAALVRDALSPPATATYFILLQWAGNQVAGIRDFRFARYAIAGAEVFLID
jgi:RNA polymerase sigma-70 factor (ECF subfamily)